MYTKYINYIFFKIKKKNDTLSVKSIGLNNQIWARIQDSICIQKSSDFVVEKRFFPAAAFP